MQKSKINSKVKEARQLKKLSLYASSVTTMLVAPFALNSCASVPDQDEIHPIVGPITIPTPGETDADVIPDPIDDPDFGDDSENNPPVIGGTPTAKAVPGRPGFVFNPYTQNMVDVEGIPSGTKVRDPQDNDESHTFFVP